MHMVRPKTASDVPNCPKDGTVPGVILIGCMVVAFLLRPRAHDIQGHLACMTRGLCKYRVPTMSLLSAHTPLQCYCDLSSLAMIICTHNDNPELAGNLVLELRCLCRARPGIGRACVAEGGGALPFCQSHTLIESSAQSPPTYLIATPGR